MAYKIGVSSGWWKIDRPADLLGLATKVGSFGGTAGVRFIQADLDTTSEFFEPRLEEQMKRIKEKMGMELGLHAEVGELMALESAERRIWEQSHLRLLETVKHAADFGVVYINVHLSARPQLYYMEREYRIMGYMYPVVDFNGKPLFHICEKSKDAKEVALKNLLGAQGIIHMDARKEYDQIVSQYYRDLEEEWARKRIPVVMEHLKQTPYYQQIEKQRLEEKNPARQAALEARMAEMVREEEFHERRRVHDDIQKLAEEEFPERLYIVWTKAPNACYHIETAEIAAYKVVGAYMKETGDPIWSTLCNGLDVEKAYIDAKTHADMNAAVATKYLEGHLTIKDHYLNKKYLDGMSVLEWLEKKNMVLAFEIPEAHEGTEGLLRLFNPLDAYLLIKKIGSEKLKLCIDFEHMLAHKLKVDDFIKNAPSDIGKHILLFHLGKPIPYFGMAHAPIPIGSRAQEIIYKWLYDLRKKGFKDGYFIYERGGGKSAFEIMQNTVWTMRQIAQFLEKDTEPDNLPPEFYGVAEQTKETFARQFVAMRDHAWDPLEGLLTIPEEKHTFLSKAAVDKGKREEWEKRKYR